MNNRLLAVGAIVLILLVGGAGFGIFWTKMNKPMERWVAYPLTPFPQVEQRQAWVDEWAEIGEQDGVLRAVVLNEKLVDRWGLANEDSAVEQLRERSFVDLSKDTETMRVGISGIRKEMDDLNRLSGALFNAIKDQFVVNHPELKQVLSPPGQ